MSDPERRGAAVLRHPRHRGLRGERRILHRRLDMEGQRRGPRVPAQQGRTGIIDDFLQPIREGLFEPGDPKVEIRPADCRGRLGGGRDHGPGALLNGNAYENQYVFVIQVAGDTVLYLREYMDSDYAHSVSSGAGGAGGAAGARL